MEKRYITLTAINKRVSLKNYIAGIKKAKSMPEVLFPHGLTCWYSCTGRDIMQQFLAGINDRITQAIPYKDRG